MQDVEPLVQNVIKVFLIASDSAARIASRIATHNGSKSVQDSHMMLGLVYRLLTPMSPEDQRQSTASIEEVLSDTETESDDDEQAFADDTSLDPPAKFAWLCECDFCRDVRRKVRDFDDGFQAEDNLQQMFYDAIQRVSAQHQLRISDFR